MRIVIAEDRLFRTNHVFANERQQVLRDARAARLGRERFDRAAVEDLALARASADDVALGGVEAVQASLE